jgi:hypothetical protein
MHLLPVKRGIALIPQVAFQQRHFLRAYYSFAFLPGVLVSLQAKVFPASVTSPSIWSPPSETTKVILMGGPGCPLMVCE